ncbi:MAG: 6-phosphogluconate dehydrogenase [Bacteroidota bacterium]
MEPQSFGGKVKRTAKKILKRILLFVIVVGIVAFCISYWGVYDEGVRAGVVLRISKKGFIFKTYEGQLNLQTFGGLKGTSPFMEAFDFSVESDREEVIKDLESVALNGERVNLHYVKRFARFPWRGDTKYFVTKVERLKN